MINMYDVDALRCQSNPRTEDNLPHTIMPMHYRV